MGRHHFYARCPESPTEMPKESQSCRWKLWGPVCICIAFLALISTFTLLGLYLKQSAECESHPWNHTSSAEGRMTELQQEAEAESNLLWPQLAAVNQSLADTRKDWASCKEELNLSKNTTDVLEDRIKTKQEDVHRLHKENTDLKKELARLNSSLEACWKERDNKDLEIKHLQVQLSARQTSSGVVLSGGFIPSFLLLLVPGLLYSLL